MEFDLTMLYLSKSYVVVPYLKLYHMPFIWINIIIIIIKIPDPYFSYFSSDFDFFVSIKRSNHVLSTYYQICLYCVYTGCFIISVGFDSKARPTDIVV